MKTSLRISLIFFLILLLSSCDSLTGGSNKNTINFDTNLYSGTQGLQLTLNLPDSVLEGQTLFYESKIENIGPYPVSAVAVIGFTEGEVTTNDEKSRYSADISLKGKTAFENTNDFQVIKFPAKIQELNQADLDLIKETGEKPTTKIRTAVCYNYKGVVGTEVCIDPSTLETGDRGKCGSMISNIGGGQGGPVSVTKVETKMITYGTSIAPQFKIFIQNSGSGIVLAYGANDRVCKGAGMRDGDLNSVQLNDITMSAYKIGDFDCTPEVLELTGQETYFTCTLKQGRSLASKTTYKTFLSLEILYGYKITQNKDIIVEPSGR